MSERPALTPDSAIEGQITIDEYKPEDAALVAAMWRDSQSVWYGGDMTSARLTEEQVQLDIRNIRRLAAFVARAGDRIVGWCDLTIAFDEPSHAYVHALNADPRVHKRGVGRRLLRAAFDRAMALGYRQLNLDTWAGNRRAMPLYKKMGFFWVPGTSVVMHNYLPTVLRSPYVQRFLDNIDWYSALRQPTAMIEDDYQLEGRPVYTYHFERDRQQLRIAIDRSSGEMLAVEGPHFAAGLTVPPRIIVGVPDLARCRLTSGTQARLGPGALWLEGGPEPAQRIVEDLEGGGEATSTLELKAHTVGSRQVRAELQVDSTALSLAASVEVVPPLQVNSRSRYWSVQPACRTHFALDVSNNTASPQTISLRAFPTDELEVLLEGVPLLLQPGQKCTLAAQVQAKRPGVHFLRLEPAAEGVDAGLGGLEIPVVAPDFGAVMAYWRGDEVVLESEWARVTVEKSTGLLSVYDGRTDQKLATAQLRIGPPYLPPRAWKTGDQVAILTDGPLPVIRHSQLLPEPARLRLERRFTLEPGGRLRIEAALHNADELDLSPVGRWDIRDEIGARHIAVPLLVGVLHTPTVGVPDWEEGKVSPSELAENWLAREYESRVLGIHWKRAESLSLWDDNKGVALGGVSVPLQPGQQKALDPLELWVGTGDWRSARAQWYGATPPSARHFGALRLEAAPASLVLDDRTASVEVTAFSEVLRPAEVDVQASSPADLDVAPINVRLAGVQRGSPGRYALSVSATGEQAGIRAIGLQASSHWTRTSSYLPAILLQRGAKCEIREVSEQGQPLLCIDNGWATIRVAPAFAGAVVAWEREGVNHLHTSFPTPDVFTWFGPWYGGISPAIGLPEHQHVPGQIGLLARDQLQWQVLPAIKRRQRVWSGVRLWGRSSALPWLRVEVEYLTLPGSDLLLANLCLANLASGRETVRAGFNAFVKPNDTRADAAVHWSPFDPPYIVPHHQTFDKRGGPFAAIEGRGASIAAVALSPETAIDAYAMGETGADLFVVAKPDLSPGGEFCVSALFALVRDGGEAKCLSLLVGNQDL